MSSADLLAVFNNPTDMRAATFCLALLMIFIDQEETIANSGAEFSPIGVLLHAHHCLLAACCWQTSLPEAILGWDQPRSELETCFTSLASFRLWKLSWLSADVLEHCKSNKKQGTTADAQKDVSKRPSDLTQSCATKVWDEVQTYCS